MILYDIQYNNKPDLVKFEGNKSDLQAIGITKSLIKAKKQVLKELELFKKDIEEQIEEINNMSTPEDVPTVSNPFI